MTKKIESLSEEGKRVSLHCVSESMYKRLNVFDISYKNGSASNHLDFIIELSKKSSVKKIIHPFAGIASSNNVKFDSKEPAIHVEIIN